MIYFIKNSVTLAIKIGYGKAPARRLAQLQSNNQHELTLLGTIQGELADEAVIHGRFAAYRERGEWFRGEIIGQVTELIRREAALPAEPKTTVIIIGPGVRYNHLEAICRELDEVHTQTPIGMILGFGGVATASGVVWANTHKIRYRIYDANWARYGRGGAPTAALRKMLRATCDRKLLMVVTVGERTKGTQAMMKRAEAAGVGVVEVML